MGERRVLLLAWRRKPHWKPDFGPKHLHPTAGATVVGARVPLIAFNINLNTNDLTIAREIAKVVRQSNGGLPYVKAIGVALATRRPGAGVHEFDA